MSREDSEALAGCSMVLTEEEERLKRQCEAKLKQTSAAMYRLLRKCTGDEYHIKRSECDVSLTSKRGTPKAEVVFLPDFSKDLAHMCQMSATITASSRAALSPQAETLDMWLCSAAAELGMEIVGHEVTRTEAMRDGKPAEFEYVLTRQYAFGFR